MLPGRSAQVFPKQAGKTFIERNVIFDYLTQLFWHFEAFYSRFPYNLEQNQSLPPLFYNQHFLLSTPRLLHWTLVAALPSSWKSLSYWDCTKNLALSEGFSLILSHFISPSFRPIYTIVLLIRWSGASDLNILCLQFLIFKMRMRNSECEMPVK